MTTFSQVVHSQLHRRNDCCDKCPIEKSCDKVVGRCYSSKINTVEQCQGCKICMDFRLPNGELAYKAQLGDWRRVVRIHKGDGQ